jgi:glycosyltransferase involved in cell wall biosynthesis
MPRPEEPFDFVFWQNSISLHQASLLRALSTVLGKKVLLVVEGATTLSRHGLGWEDADYGSTVIRTPASMNEWLELVEETRSARAHVFTGLGAYPSVDRSRMALLSEGCHGHVAVFSESWDPRGTKGLARRIRAALVFRRLTAEIDTVLATGTKAEEQFRRLGVAAERILPFCYTVPESTPSLGETWTPHTEVRVIFVGSLIRCKNVDLLFSALTTLKQYNWSLAIVGDGPLRPRLESRVSTEGWRDRVTFHGLLPSDTTRRVLSDKDLLVLPSSYDGWGAVVNEALMSGVPAVVSDAAGASDLIVGRLQGAVFGSGDAEALKAVLEEQLKSHRSREQRQALADWARRAVSAETLASYLVSRINEPSIRLPPPWRDPNVIQK